MYFMSQNWLITHCLQPWSGLELTGVSEHPGMLSTMLVSCRLKRFWRGLSQFGGGGGGWRKNEDSEMCALFEGGNRG